MPTLVRVPVASTSLNDDSSTIFSEGLECRHISSNSNGPRTTGTSENQYNETFKSYVSSILQKHQCESSQTRIPDYHSMKDEEKKREHHSLEELLKRLRLPTPRPPHYRERTVVSELPNNTNFPGDCSVTTLGMSFDKSTSNRGMLDGNTSQSQDTKVNHTEQSSLALRSPDPDQNGRLYRSNNSSSLFSLTGGRAGSSSYDQSTIETSIALLSPHTSERFIYEDRKGPNQDCKTSSSEKETSESPAESEKDESPIELPRRNDESVTSLNLFDSPVNPKSAPLKRLASDSGKRGADLSRIRTNNDSFAFLEQSCGGSSGMIDSPSPLMCDSIPSLASESCQNARQTLFAASQSPILHDSDACSDDDGGRSLSLPRRSSILQDSDTSSSGDSDTNANTVDQPAVVRERTNTRGSETVETVDCTILQKRRVRWNVGMDESYYDEPNISLRDGALFRMKPLRVRQHQRRRERSDLGPSGHSFHSAPLSFPDPFSSYRDSVAARLNTIFQWLSDKEMAWENSHSCGVVVSLSTKQIISVTLKLLLASRQHKRGVSQSQTADDRTAPGGTVIVVRDKEDVLLWESALREGTFQSVLNHAAMPAKERQRATTAGVCAGFDVVLTTFDAFKSKDIATPVDEHGHAVMHRVGFEDGWYSSRSGSSISNRCVSLTVLHQMTWKRIIFVDVLGRKSYLSKPGTARVAAAIALDGFPRFMFFCNSSSNTQPFMDTAKKDRKAIRSIAGVLRLENEHAEEQVWDALIDMDKLS